MGMLLKDMYSESFYDELCQVLSVHIPNFDAKDEFKKKIFNEEWKDLALKSRLRLTTKVLHDYISNDVELAFHQLIKIVKDMSSKELPYVGFSMMTIPDYIEVYLFEFFDKAMHAFEEITEYASCEFAIRPFLDKYPSKTMSIIYGWADHTNEHVRRLASEGCRPNLPWAIALPKFQNDPKLVWKLIDKLKDDPSKYVRLSVSNNINDISKKHPKEVIKNTKKWYGFSQERNSLLKHGCRTLLKSGHPDIMNIFGYVMHPLLKVENLLMEKAIVAVGESLSFKFDLINDSNENIKLRIEYAIYYRRKNGTFHPKTFKISEKTIERNSKINVIRKHSFKKISTRKFYAGVHKLSIIINGMRMVDQTFELFNK